jgi:hypothetical protein
LLSTGVQVRFLDDRIEWGVSFYKATVLSRFIKNDLQPFGVLLAEGK